MQTLIIIIANLIMFGLGYKIGFKKGAMYSIKCFKFIDRVSFDHLVNKVKSAVKTENEDRTK
jgi:hypothetical protein